MTKGRDRDCRASQLRSGWLAMTEGEIPLYEEGDEFRMARIWIKGAVDEICRGQC